MNRDHQLKVKRAIDLVVSVAGLLSAAPALLGAAGLVRATLGAPVFFRQQRPGRHGHPFFIYKFRTMTGERDAQGQLLPDAQRLTRIGRFLRASSLDEIPQLWNVLKGEMSLVGPRPLLMQYLSRYSPRQAKRHDVRPGITGLAQVRGRNALSWEEKFELDLEYVENWSLPLDLKILAQTALGVVGRRGISQGGHATMPEFMGSSPRAPS
ncbi:MAG: sugar transferase [Myxococcales bacterium]|nr:sugar transferase [Myxococcales bacterium]